MSGRFAGKAAIVTGGGSGLGAAVARVLSDEGASVLVVDIDGDGAERVAAELGGASFGLQADVCTEVEVEEYTRSAVKRFGRLDAVHCNAGIAGPLAAITDVTAAELDRTLAVNARGAFLGVREAAKAMVELGNGGSIVITSSALGLIGATGATPYVMSKHALVGLTKAAALELGRSGIRVNAVCPGYIDTPLMRPTEAVVGGGDEETGRRAMESLTLLGRYARPQEIAAMAVWLLSDEASYATGGAFSVDGAMASGLNLSAPEEPSSDENVPEGAHA
jgi:NAD(P)-dependent dehydrogenase (short-subunit alcohol dehydrogenase family)